MNHSQEEPAGPEGLRAPSESKDSGQGPRFERTRRPLFPVSAPRWARVVPFFLSAFFFLSALFVVLAPLPILFLHFRSGRRWALLAAVTNSVIVGLAGGPASLAIYLSFIISIVLVLPELLRKGKSIEKSAVASLLGIFFVGLSLVGIYSQLHHLNPIHELKSQVTAMVDYVSQSAPPGSVSNLGDPEEWKRNLLIEFPSIIAVFSLILVWANLVLLLLANPGGIRDRLGLDPAFSKKWKAPEFLIWPTILTGFFLIVDAGRVSDVSLNIFKFLMAIYAIQGLSILSFFFDAWSIRGIFKVFGFVFAVFLVMPLLLGLGLFDLWFDFRGKFRQS